MQIVNSMFHFFSVYCFDGNMTHSPLRRTCRKDFNNVCIISEGGGGGGY